MRSHSRKGEARLLRLEEDCKFLAALCFAKTGNGKHQGLLPPVCRSR